MVEHGYMPGAIVKKTTKKYRPTITTPFDLWAVVEHIAEGNANSWYYLQITGPGSSHFFVDFAGNVYQLASIYERTWANGLNYKNGQYIDPQGYVVDPSWWRLKVHRGIDPNLVTISVEHEGWPRDVRTQAMKDADQHILQFIHAETGIVYKVGDTLIRHADISPKNRAFCPGPNFDMEALAMAANGIDPLKVRKIVDEAGHEWFCGTGFFEYWQKFGALRAFGHPRSNEYSVRDLSGETVTIMEFERQWLKMKPSEAPTTIRPMLIHEIMEMIGRRL